MMTGDVKSKLSITACDNNQKNKEEQKKEDETRLY